MDNNLKKIVIICTRRIGDVFFTIPIIKDLNILFPHSKIDLLVFNGTADIIDGLSSVEINKVINIDIRESLKKKLIFIAKNFKKYDFAISMLPGDRPVIYSWFLGKTPISPLSGESKNNWKKCLLKRWVKFDNLNTHTLVMYRKIIKLLGETEDARPALQFHKAYKKKVDKVLISYQKKNKVILHLTPKFIYKRWTNQGWRSIINFLHNEDYDIFISSGGSNEELEYKENILKDLEITYFDVSNKFSITELSYLISKANLFIGTDTAITHIAGYMGIKTIAIFGPSNPIKWGPWPKNFIKKSDSPWKLQGSQKVENVYLIQGEGNCVPCMEEGCFKNIHSRSFCLEKITEKKIITAIKSLTG